MQIQIVRTVHHALQVQHIDLLHAIWQQIQPVSHALYAQLEVFHPHYAQILQILDAAHVQQLASLEITRKSHALTPPIEPVHHAQITPQTLSTLEPGPYRQTAHGNANMAIYKMNPPALNAPLTAGVLKMSSIHAPQTHSQCLYHQVKTTAPANLGTSEMGPVLAQVRVPFAWLLTIVQGAMPTLALNVP